MLPKFNEFCEPVLKALSDNQEWKITQIYEFCAEYYNLTETDLQIRHEKSDVLIYRDRISWACSYLKKAGYIASQKRSFYTITNDGLSALKNNLKFDTNFVKSIREKAPRKVKEKSDIKELVQQEQPVNNETSQSPIDIIEEQFNVINDQLAEELLAAILEQSPSFFERLVIKLLVKMGYGGIDRANVTQYSKDGGIDGIIYEDKLGLDKIYIQAKRYAPDNIVGSPEIQQFIGAISQKGGTKGVFITTSSFSKAARDNISANIKIVLIDGKTFCNFMIEYGLGVSTQTQYEYKKIDSDFFE